MRLKIALLCMASLVLTACGGGGGGGSSSPSPFAGTFAGTWTSNQAQNGTATITVANSGNVSGTTYNAQLDENGSISGSIQNDGDVSGTINYPSTGPFNMSGTLVLTNGGNTLSGNVTGGGGTTTFSLTRQ